MYDLEWKEVDKNRTAKAAGNKFVKNDASNSNDRLLNNLNASRTIYLECGNSNQVHCIEAKITVSNFAMESNISIIIDFIVGLEKVLELTNGKKTVLLIRSSVELKNTFDQHP